MDPIVLRIDEARAALQKAKRDAQAVWTHYQKSYESRGLHRDAARSQAATHLPEDLLELLKIDRYGSAL